MKLYLAKMVFAIHSNPEKEISQFEEKIRMIYALNDAEAFLKAYSTGIHDEESFVNANNIEVKWVFVDIAELTCIKEINDGMELYSRIEEKENALLYIEYMRSRSESIKNSFSLNMTLV